MDIESLILGVSQKETDAFEKLYLETKTSVYALALSILKRPQDAEDVMQDTYLNIYAAAYKYLPKGKPMAWILRITRNLAFDKLRQKSRMELQLEDQWMKIEAGGGSEEPDVDKLLLEAVMKNLPEVERQIVVLHSITGLKHREIAKILEIPLSTAISKYHRSLSKLKKMLKEEDKK